MSLTDEILKEIMKRELAISRPFEPTAGEVFRFENPFESDEYDPGEYDA